MTNAEVWNLYAERTAAITTTSRTLAFATGAACWVIKPQDERIPLLLLVALALVVTFFALDTLQFFVAARWLRRWARKEEVRIQGKTGNRDGETYELPWDHDKWAFRFWCGKLIRVISVTWFLIMIHVVFMVAKN